MEKNIDFKAGERNGFATSYELIKDCQTIEQAKTVIHRAIRAYDKSNL